MIVRFALIWLLTVGTAWAHDLAATQARLIEGPGNSYTLIATVPPDLAALISAPQLPDRCRLSDDPRTHQSEAEIRFAFTCGSALTSSDVVFLPWKRDGVLLSAHRRDGTIVTNYFIGDGAFIRVDLASVQAGSMSFGDAAVRYTTLGIEHILFGIDHLLFILGLLLIVDGVWALLKTITAFTLAHSVTLGLATTGWVSVPSAPVEAAIALSIVLVAAEGLRSGQESPAIGSPWLMAFAFGLLHGFGFAGALSELGLPTREIPLALLFFNIGVEIGQLAFVTVVLLIRRVVLRLVRSWPNSLAAVPGYIIGAVAMFWLVERVSAILRL